MASHETPTSHGPRPAPSTDARTYQSRQGVSPTSTPSMKFNNTKENGKHGMYHGTVMGYTGINGSEPSAMEKGHPTDQARRGASGDPLSKSRR